MRFILAFLLGAISGASLMGYVWYQDTTPIAEAAGVGGATTTVTQADAAGPACPEDPDRVIWSSDDDPYTWEDTERRYPEAE